MGYNILHTKYLAFLAFVKAGRTVADLGFPPFLLSGLYKSLFCCLNASFQRVSGHRRKRKNKENKKRSSFQNVLTRKFPPLYAQDMCGKWWNENESNICSRVVRVEVSELYGCVRYNTLF